MATKRNWALIVIGIIIFAAIVGVGALVTAGFVIYRQMNVGVVAIESPEEEFAKVRARFAGQTPYIELNETPDGEAVVVHREQERETTMPLGGLHVLAWVPHEKKLLRLTLPFWMLRLTGRHGVQFSSDDRALGGRIRLGVTAEDLERRGPGLILDHTRPRGERVIVWAE